jgi:hypothetical protein
MANIYYTYTSGIPAAISRATSQQLRNEFTLVSAGFDAVSNALTGKGTVSGQNWSGPQNFTGAVVTYTTQTPGDNSTKGATTAYADAAVAVEAGNRAAAVNAEQTRATTAEGTKVTKTGGDTISGTHDYTSATLRAATKPLGTNTTEVATMAALFNQALTTALPSSSGIPVNYVMGLTGVNSPGWVPGPNITRSARSANTVLALTDQASLIDYTANTFAQTLPAASTVGVGFYVYLRNTGSGVITITPNGTEKFIGSLGTSALNNGDVQILVCIATGAGGTNWEVLRIQGMNKQIYTNGSGNFTVPAGVYRIFVECWGAGGGAPAGGGAGGGGGYSAGWLNVTPGQTISYAVGAGSSGAAGGNTTFGVLTANGGSLGSSGNQVAGGTASGGDINIAGGLGNCPTGSGGAATYQFIGGGSPNGAMPGSSVIGAVGATPGGGGHQNGGVATGGNGQINIRWV